MSATAWVGTWRGDEDGGNRFAAGTSTAASASKARKTQPLRSIMARKDVRRVMQGLSILLPRGEGGPAGVGWGASLLRRGLSPRPDGSAVSTSPLGRGGSLCASRLHRPSLQREQAA